MDYTPRFNFGIQIQIKMKMVKIFGLFLLIAISLASYQNANCNADHCKNTKLTSMNTIVKEKEIACKLTTPELQKRRESILASLKKQVFEKQELQDGYKYKFESTDSLIDELSSFIKTERQCCDFFSFSLLVSGDDGFTWLSITVPK